ncbi:hypothetical protein H6G04_00425 [Calothrix membranacea FACHB-236]|nr:hypothetical protein [Calothrix membranacea FACHB-236]
MCLIYFSDRARGDEGAEEDKGDEGEKERNSYYPLPITQYPIPNAPFIDRVNLAIATLVFQSCNIYVL